jgi:Capsule assembly protein Wzi
VEFRVVLCWMVLLTTGISAASTIAAPDQTPSTQAETPSQQTSSPPAAPTPPPASADQLPAPRETIHFVRYEPLKSIEGMSSTYIPLDSWIYPAVMRLYGLGFVDTVFLGMRPWTRLSVAHMLDLSADRITGSTSDEAIDIYTAIEKDLQPDLRIPLDQKFGRAGLDSVYERVMGIGGTPLRDSFHLGQTDINDFGRPYASGFNNYTGLSARAHYGMFSVYFRGEIQHAPSWEGYPLSLAETLARIDDFATFSSVPLPGNTTIPLGPISSVNNLTVLEGYVSAHIVGHEVSFGKMDNWYGPGVGGGMAWSNNAENVWSFRINRVEPLYIPYISRIAGLIRYDFFVGPLKGHNDPVSPWTHAEKISFKPTPNFEFGFQRTVIWGGVGHAPVTFGTFWHSFYSISDTNGGEKFSRNDPGARFSAVDFSWRLPYLTKWLTLYSDSEVHDDVFPITAPRHAAIRPGLYLSHFPGAPKLDLRAEAVSTDPDTGLSTGGQNMYTEVVQRNGYTNNGLLMGDWIGREGKGGQAWLTYHLSPREWLQVSYRGAKAAKDFIPGGTTQTDFSFDVVKRLTPDVELKANLQYERWLIPIYKTGRQTDTSTTFQLTWYPRIDRRF